MEREYGGIKTFETKGGASLSNRFYHSAPKWGNAGPWELYSGTPTGNQKLSRSGKRIWNLSFSYLDSGDVFGSNQMLNTERWDYGDGLGSDDIADDATNYRYNILTDDNFFSQVIHKTNGGQLPFIFQPDKNDMNMGSLAICKFDMKSIKFQQQAPNLYRISSLKIREVW